MKKVYLIKSEKRIKNEISEEQKEDLFDVLNVENFEKKSSYLMVSVILKDFHLRNCFSIIKKM